VKIDDSLNGVPAIRRRETRKSKDGSATSSGSPVTAGDSVEITTTSARLNQLEAELGLIDSANTGKLEAVREAIANGSFQVDEEAVAEALVRSTMDQLRRQGKDE
jgi:negative regulator of flagellin synthesis FlgM